MREASWGSAAILPQPGGAPAARVTMARAIPFAPPPSDPVDSARAAGLRYTSDRRPGIRRRGHGSHAAYLSPDGRPLRFMPVGDFKNLSDADTAALVAHLQMLPSSDNAPPPFEVRPLGRVLYAIGKLELVPAEHLDRDGVPLQPLALTGERLLDDEAQEAGRAGGLLEAAACENPLELRANLRRTGAL